jgi:hypothetical protein
MTHPQRDHQTTDDISETPPEIPRNFIDIAASIQMYIKHLAFIDGNNGRVHSRRVSSGVSSGRLPNFYVISR